MCIRDRVYSHSDQDNMGLSNASEYVQGLYGEDVYKRQIEVSYTKNFPGEPTGKANPELLYNLHPLSLIHI